MKSFSKKNATNQKKQAIAPKISNLTFAPDNIVEQRHLPKQSDFKGLAQEFRVSVQPKLAISSPGDRYEQEADHVASQVMQRLNSNDKVDESQPKISPYRPSLQRKSTDSNTPSTHGLSANFLRSGGIGQTLPNSILPRMERAFGRDLSNVRIHNNAKADNFSRSIQAKAFTTGQNIYFKRGEYQPHTHQGQQLLAHEITHTFQQGDRPVIQRYPDVSLKTRKSCDMGEFIAGNLTSVELRTSELRTCSAVIFFNPANGIGMLFHYPAKEYTLMDHPITDTIAACAARFPVRYFVAGLGDVTTMDMQGNFKRFVGDYRYFTDSEDGLGLTNMVDTKLQTGTIRVTAETEVAASGGTNYTLHLIGDNSAEREYVCIG